MIYGSTERLMMPEDLISHNFPFFLSLNAFSEFFSMWFSRVIQSTLSHYPAETTIPILRTATIFVLSRNSECVWQCSQDVLIGGKSE